jgi:cell division septum initiation protein DivIVA
MSIDSPDASVTFRTRLFGFDKEEVRDCLRNLAIDHEDTRRQIERLTAMLKTSEDAVGGPASHEPIALQVERVLVSAHRVAEEVRVEASNAARTTLREAQEEAAQLRSQAETDAAELAVTGQARLTLLKAEIDRMTERRQQLQELLDQTADRLNEIAGSIRQAHPPAITDSETETPGQSVTVMVPLAARTHRATASE